MSNSFVKHEDVQNLLRISAGLNTTDGDERFKSIMHRLLENICTLIDDYNITQEEFWQAINYLHELGGRQEAALLAAGLGLDNRLRSVATAEGESRGSPLFASITVSSTTFWI